MILDLNHKKVTKFANFNKKNLNCCINATYKIINISSIFFVFQGHHKTDL